MVYLLHRYFGRDGREEAEGLLERRRRCEQSAHPAAFNERTGHWLAFYMFAFFTDRDGKFQLAAWLSRLSIPWRVPLNSC